MDIMKHMASLKIFETLRAAHSASVVNGKIYVIGGFAGRALPTVEE